MGRGWWGQMNTVERTNTNWALLLQCNFYDAQHNLLQQLVSDASSWRMSTGAIVYDNIYNGETYNESQETQGWTEVGFEFKKGQWVAAVAGNSSDEYPQGVLSAQLMEPIKRIEEFIVIKYWQVYEGVWVFDLGRHISGWCRLSVRAVDGANITLKHAEILTHGTGYIYTKELRTARQTDSYFLLKDSRFILKKKFICK